MDNRALIIGGGITGLSAAYYLNKAGFRATVVEKSPTLGGIIHTEKIQGCLLETGPDSFMAAKPWAMELIREVGLAEEVINSNDHLRITYVLKKGKLIPLPDGMMMMVPTKKWPLITTRLLSWPCKIRMGMELFRKADGAREDRSVADFLIDHYGQEALDYLAEPLLAGVYGGDPKLLSVNSVLTRFVEIEAKYGSLSRGVLQMPKPKGSGSGGSLFRTLKGGLGQLIDKLVPAADVVRGEAQAIQRTASGYRVRVDGNWVETAQIFIGAPAYVAAKLLTPFDGALSGLLNTIPYNSSMTLSLGYDKKTFDHPLKGFGFLVPKLERKRLKACTWVNNKFDFRAAEDKILLRCFLGGDSFNESDDSLAQIAQEELREIMGFQAKPVFHHVGRWPDSMAQYTVGHKKRVDQIKALMGQLPGIAIGGNGYNGIGVPDCIHSGKEAAQNIAQQLGAGAGSRPALQTAP
jgi:oxygen-dependent protoporphyrinogen oxidase